MRGFDRCRRAVALSMLVGGILTLPAYAPAQEGNAAGADHSAVGDTLFLAPAALPAPLAPLEPGISAQRPASAVRRAFLSDTGRAGMYIGLALGAQIGAVQALTSCQRRREGHCLENHLPSEIAFTVGSGAIGALIGTLIHRRREAAGGAVRVAAPASTLAEVRLVAPFDESAHGVLAPGAAQR